MSQYLHSPLVPGTNTIRLLRLMPQENGRAERTEVQCELFEYPLQNLDKRTHLYEALSYTWGGGEKTCSITIKEQNLDVTPNLYAALLCLRGRSLERLLWIDAICIDQNNLDERSQQVQLMAMIYSKAYCVLVWLGETTDDVEGALEDIQCAAYEKSTEPLNKIINEKAILNLLQRQWFQRIWVLQEVAAARHIIVICGSIEIDGYAFCSGLRSLRNSRKLSYTAIPELQSLPLLIDLIEQAGLRPKYTTHSLERHSLEICSLAELIGMFYTRQASDPRDKVYALLGMSSDDPSKANLQPNYQISWESLFQQLVRFLLGKDISVDTSGQRSVIKTKGYIIGRVYSVTGDDRQNVEFSINNKALKFDLNGIWTLRVSPSPIQKDDIICFLHGASNPTIIRMCKDHFAIIMIAATPLNTSRFHRSLKTSQSTMQFSRDFLLVWDWERPHGELQGCEEYRIMTKIHSQAREHSKAGVGNFWDEATRLWNDIMILDDLGEHTEASKRLPEAIRCYATAFGKERLDSQYIQKLSPSVDTERYGNHMMTWHGTHVSGGECGRTLISFAAGEGDTDIVKLLLDTVNPDLKDGNFGLTPLSWAARNGHEAVVKLLLETGKVEIDSKDDFHCETPLSWAAQNGHEDVIKLLLETGKVDADSRSGCRQTPLFFAAKNGYATVVELLLTTAKVEADLKDLFGRTPLSWAAENGHEAVVKLLLETGKVKVDYVFDSGETPLSRAGLNGHETIVNLLNEHVGRVAQGGGHTVAPFRTFNLVDLFFLVVFVLLCFSLFAFP